MLENLPAPEAVAEIIRLAEAARASDVHLQLTGTGCDLTFRLDGVMTPLATVSRVEGERMIGRIKYLAKLKTYQESLPQDGRIDRVDGGATHDIRVATYPTVTGEKVVLRLFNPSIEQGLHDLGLPVPLIVELESVLRLDTGLLLLTGPAGSGKTTTIYACLRFLAGLGGRHIITVEDPAEQIIPGLMQTEVNEARGLSYAVAARHLLRQDPQVLVLGEIRDEETASLAVRAGLTGHLVISTLHAGSCQGVLERLSAMCADRQALISALEMVVNQRLMRRFCEGCAGQGCVRCLRTGYLGRIPLAEWVRVTPEQRLALRAGGSGALQPPVSLMEGAREVIRRGWSDEKEYQRITGLCTTTNSLS